MSEVERAHSRKGVCEGEREGRRKRPLSSSSFVLSDLTMRLTLIVMSLCFVFSK